MLSKLKAINIFKKTSRNYIVPPIPDSIWTNPWHFIAFGFGTGTIPIAQGTFGTLIAIPFYLLLRNFSLLSYGIILAIIIIGGIWLCGKVERTVGVRDHTGINWDEIGGFLLTMY